MSKKRSFYRKIILSIGLLLLHPQIRAETLRVLIEGSQEISLEHTENTPLRLSYWNSALIFLSGDDRFFRGIELELTVPQEYLNYRGSLGIALYGDLQTIPSPGIADLDAQQIFFEPLPNKLSVIYQISLKNRSGLRTTPYTTVLSTVVPPSAFPLLFRLMPVIKGLSESMETLAFYLRAKPLFTDEGAVRFIFQYPEQPPRGTFTVLVDDRVVEDPQEELLLKEGEHSLVILSEDYRNESKRFQVERAQILDLRVELQDPTPLLIFEAPANTRIYLDDEIIRNRSIPYPVEPGPHTIRFQIGDYSVVKSMTLQKGKTYRVALQVALNISEE